jgi:hypothetical protein
MGSLSILEKRKQLSACYGYKGGKWAQKVDKMSENQVIALYQQFMQRKFFDKDGVYNGKSHGC